MKKVAKKKINFIFKIIAVLASVGTVFIVVLTYLTLKEIQVQRIISYQPNLVINDGFNFNLSAKLESQKDSIKDLNIKTFGDLIDTNSNTNESKESSTDYETVLKYKNKKFMQQLTVTC